MEMEYCANHLNANDLICHCARPVKMQNQKKKKKKTIKMTRDISIGTVRIYAQGTRIC